MRKFILIMAMAIFAAASVSCVKDNSYPDTTPVEYGNFALNGANSGTWELVGMDGAALADGLYQYVKFNTKEYEFEFIQNINSQMPESMTGVYTLTYDINEGTVLCGDYDHSSGPWLNDYVITELTRERMVWAVLGDPESFYVYKTCPEIPADRIPVVKSM